MNRRYHGLRLWLLGVLIALGFALPFLAHASDAAGVSAALRRVFSARDYNTRVVMSGTGLLGIACGVVGTFMVLRKRALFGDAISHATLPGIALAFLFSVALGGTGKSMLALLLGAGIAGLLAMAATLAIRHCTRLPEDSILGIVLSVFFGAGIALLGVVQHVNTASAAGLETFIYGKTASMLGEDGWRIAWCAIALLGICALLFKEFRALCFDAEFARAQGWPIRFLDALMMGMVVVTTVIGLQAVGLILVIALLILPPSAAGFWTDDLRALVLLAATIGALSGVIGSGLSATFPALPAGGVIVLVAAAMFLFSFLFGRSRGVAVRFAMRVRVERRVNRQNALRAMYEISEAQAANEAIAESALRTARYWPGTQLHRTLRGLVREALVRKELHGWVLTPAGRDEAMRMARNHRLWELYLIHHADVAPSHVDRDADLIEHVLGHEMVAELEGLLDRATPTPPVPQSPHPISIPTRGEAP